MREDPRGVGQKSGSLMPKTGEVGRLSRAQYRGGRGPAGIAPSSSSNSSDYSTDPVIVLTTEGADGKER